jgi:hypothetical protein
MPTTQLLLGTTSRCCSAPNIIVRSREGGFITQNCAVCGKPRAIHECELPDLICGNCSKDLAKARDTYSNYVYRCISCSREWMLATLVPAWQELYSYHGYAIPQNSAQPKTPLQAAQVESLLQLLSRFHAGS